MKKILFGLILFFAFFINVDASSISKINMDIYVDHYGTATVTETWNANVTNGSEGWHPYYSIGNSSIYDVSVSMDGDEFTIVDSLVKYGSLSDKAYKAGLYYPEFNEVDVVFGISSYGIHEYVIKYKISNFVSATSDADMIYWNLFPVDFNVNPKNVFIKIYSDFKYDNSWNVWGYGKKGAPCYISDGVIEVSSDGVLHSNEYITILAKFPKGTFNTSSVLDNDFNYYYKMSLKGTTQYGYKRTLSYVINGFLWIFFRIIIFGIPLLIIYIISLFFYNDRPNIRFGDIGNKVRGDVLPFRDIPCNKDLFRAYWIASNYKLIKKKENFLGAIFLKWIKDGNVRFESKNKLDKDVCNIIFIKRPSDIVLEGQLYDYMVTASVDGILDADEFKKWCKKNCKKLFNWFDNVISFENKKLVDEGKANVCVYKNLPYKVYEIDNSMMLEAEMMAGLKKFLINFSSVKERDAVDISLWQDYLIYAQLFGIADKVANQFEKFYPEIGFNRAEVGYNYNDVLFINSLSFSGIKIAKRSNFYSGWGNGYSSNGGGSGAFGSGRGGGGFR